MEEHILKLIKPADIISLINALVGFTAIITLIQGKLDEPLILILAAVIADAADGTIARYSGYGILGANLDSLADVISFGAAPAAVAFVVLDNFGIAAGLFAGLFLICGILRLARFNVSGKKDGFQGIPITAGGFVVALFVLIKDFVPYFEYMFAFLLIIMSFLMISTVNYPKLKSPILLAPMALFLVLDPVFFYLGDLATVRITSFILFVLLLVYVLSPVMRNCYDRYH